MPPTCQKLGDWVEKHRNGTTFVKSQLPDSGVYDWPLFLHFFISNWVCTNSVYVLNFLDQNSTIFWAKLYVFYQFQMWVMSLLFPDMFKSWLNNFPTNLRLFLVFPVKIKGLFKTFSLQIELFLLPNIFWIWRPKIKQEASHIHLSRAIVIAQMYYCFYVSQPNSLIFGM